MRSVATEQQTDALEAHHLKAQNAGSAVVTIQNLCYYKPINGTRVKRCTIYLCLFMPMENIGVDLEWDLKPVSDDIAVYGSEVYCINPWQ